MADPVSTTFLGFVKVPVSGFNQLFIAHGLSAIPVGNAKGYRNLQVNLIIGEGMRLNFLPHSFSQLDRCR